MVNRSYIIIPLLVSAVILFFSLVWPKYQDLQVQQLNVSKKVDELEAKKKYFDKIKEIHKKLEADKEIHKKLEADKGLIARIDSALPDELSIPSMFYYIQKTAGVTAALREISFGTECGSKASKEVTSVAEKPTIKEIPLSISLAGNYPDFKRFLSTVENSVRLFEIEDISFSSPQDPEEPFSFEIELKAYGY
jgi:Tfp pilus assembly protein PilO